MIPKIIHYCWFGDNKLPESEIKNIASWKKYCPDYKIIEWNEKNFNVEANIFMSEAHKEKKYSFVSDYARLDIIYNYGGIYLDTDVELIKNLDVLLSNDAFIGTENFGRLINPGSGFGAEKNNKVIKDFLDTYKNARFINEDGVLNMTPITCLLTPILIKKGFKTNNKIQQVENITIYPTDYFCPKDYDNKLKITENTFSIHYFAGSWIDNTMRDSMKIQAFLTKIVGTKIGVILFYLTKIYKRKGLMHIFKRLPSLMKKYFKK